MNKKLNYFMALMLTISLSSILASCINNDKNPLDYEKNEDANEDIKNADAGNEITLNQDDTNISNSESEDAQPTKNEKLHKDKAFELLVKRLNLNNEDYMFNGTDAFGGYIFSYNQNKESQTGNHITYIVNPYTHNVYDEVSSEFIICLTKNNDNISEVLSVDKMEQLLIETGLVTLSNDTILQFYTHEAGSVIIAKFKKKGFEELNLYKINPSTGDVFDYYTEDYLGNLITKD